MSIVPSNRTSWNSLPPEAIDEALSYLDPSSLGNCVLVNKSCRERVYAHQGWDAIWQRAFPARPQPANGAGSFFMRFHQGDLIANLPALLQRLERSIDRAATGQHVRVTCLFPQHINASFQIIEDLRAAPAGPSFLASFEPHSSRPVSGGGRDLMFRPRGTLRIEHRMDPIWRRIFHRESQQECTHERLFFIGEQNEEWQSDDDNEDPEIAQFLAQFINNRESLYNDNQDCVVGQFLNRSSVFHNLRFPNRAQQDGWQRAITRLLDTTEDRLYIEQPNQPGRRGLRLRVVDLNQRERPAARLCRQALIALTVAVAVEAFRRYWWT